MLSIHVKREYLDKYECIKEARRILSEGIIKDMNEIQLAREIYFHTLAFYFCDRTALARKIKAHANPIDIVDGGDTLFRKIFYFASWKLFGRNK